MLVVPRYTTRPGSRPWTAHRFAVVAKLAVVVVLDHHALGGPGPGHESAAPVGRQRGPEHRLASGRHHDGADPRRGDRGDVDAPVVHGHRHDLGPRRGHDLPVEGQARVLHRHPALPGGDEGPGHHLETVAEPAGHDHLVGVGRDPASPRQVPRHRGADLATAGRRRIVEGVERAAAQHRTHGRRPLARRERRQVGRARPQVDRRRRRRRAVRPPRRLWGRRSHDGAATRAGAQVALDRELLVGVDDGAPSQAQVGGELTRGREGSSQRQPAVADRGPQRLLEPPPAAARRVDVQQHVHGPTLPVRHPSGPTIRRPTGP